MTALLMLFVLSAPPKRLPVDAAAQRVAALITGKREVLVERLGDDTVWSDSAVLERARSFPPAVQLLLAAAPARNEKPGKAVALLEAMQRDRAQWGPAKSQRNGEDCVITDGPRTALVNCAYVDYLEARYPAGTFGIKGPYEPVVLLEKDTVRALLMPMKR